MEFRIDHKSEVPIYVQLKERIRLAIATGELKPGDRLPTVREMAVDLRINANTVSRVYAELESEGCLVTQRGKGTFVAPEPAVQPARERAERLLAMVSHLTSAAYYLGYTQQEVHAAIDVSWPGRHETEYRRDLS